jgi:hypothetical protein
MKKKDKTKNLIIEQLRKTPIIEMACQKVDVSRMTFYRWKKEDAQFEKRIDEAMIDGRLLVNDLAESQLINAIKVQNLTAITYWLKHHHKSYKTRIEIEGAVSTIHELSPEQEELMRKAFNLAGINIQDYDPNNNPTEEQK